MHFGLFDGVSDEKSLFCEYSKIKLVLQMKIWPFVRNLFGSFEIPIAEAYRRIFIDIQLLMRQIELWFSSAEIQKILDLGCGEGILTERLTNAYLDAHVTGIDVTPATGWIF